MANLFEDEQEFEGWDFLAAQIYQLPRSPQYCRVVGLRLSEADQLAEKEAKKEKERF